MPGFALLSYSPGCGVHPEADLPGFLLFKLFCVHPLAQALQVLGVEWPGDNPARVIGSIFGQSVSGEHIWRFRLAIHGNHACLTSR